ncbi:MAG: hypothetical protein AAB425_04120, partial [Bdellovibrionota bacterium]
MFGLAFFVLHLAGGPPYTIAAAPSPAPQRAASPTPTGPLVYYQAATIRDLALAKEEPPLFRFEGGREEFPGTTGKTRMWTRYSTLEGSELLWENLYIENGVMSRYEMKDTSEFEDGGLAVEAGKLLFFFHKQGKLQKGNEEIGDVPIMAGPGITWLMSQNLKPLIDGDTLSFRYPVLDRLETLGFKLYMLDDKPPGLPDGKKAVVLRLKAKSFIVRAFVDPIDFTVDVETGQLLSIKGRCPVKKRTDKGPVEFQALTTFEPARMTRA